MRKKLGSVQNVLFITFKSIKSNIMPPTNPQIMIFELLLKE